MPSPCTDHWNWPSLAWWDRSDNRHEANNLLNRHQAKAQTVTPSIGALPCARQGDAQSSP